MLERREGIDLQETRNGIGLKNSYPPVFAKSIRFRHGSEDRLYRGGGRQSWGGAERAKERGWAMSDQVRRTNLGGAGGFGNRVPLHSVSLRQHLPHIPVSIVLPVRNLGLRPPSTLKFVRFRAKGGGSSPAR